MSVYTGSGFRCRRSIVCSFRVMPANGDDEDLDEAGRALLVHERSCRFAGIAGPRGEAPARTIDDLATRNAQHRVDLEAPATWTRIFHCRCQVCGELFEATGPRASYCSKSECQARRGRAA